MPWLATWFFRRNRNLRLVGLSLSSAEGYGCIRLGVFQEGR